MTRRQAPTAEGRPDRLDHLQPAREAQAVSLGNVGSSCPTHDPGHSPPDDAIRGLSVLRGAGDQAVRARAPISPSSRSVGATWPTRKSTADLGTRSRASLAS